MTEQRSTIALVAGHLAGAMLPLRVALTDLDSFRLLLFRLGWEARSLPAPYLQLAVQVAATLDAAAAMDDDDAGLDQVVEVLDRVRALYLAIDGLDQAPEGVEPAPFLAEFGGRLFELLLADYLAAELPATYTALRLLDVITLEAIPATATRPEFVRTRFRFAEIPRVIAEPRSIPARVYGWSTADLDFTLLASHLYGLMYALGLPATVEPVDQELGRGLQASAGQVARPISVQLRTPLFTVEIDDAPVEVALALLELPGEIGHKPGVILRPLIPPEVEANTDLGDGLSFAVRAGSDLGSNFGIVARPSGVEVRYPFQPDTPPPAAGFGIALIYAPDQPVLLVGEPEQTRLQVGGGTIGLDLDVVAGEPELRGSVTANDLTLVVSAGDQDGFVAGLVGGDLTVPLPMAVTWSSRTGLAFGGSAGLAVTVYPHRELGPVRVEEISAALRGTAQSAGVTELSLVTGVGLSGTIGPVGFVLDGIGLGLRMRFGSAAGAGNAGPVDISVGFQPSAGLGLVIDAGPVTGGGFIRYEPDRGRYLGVVELDVYEIGVSAIAILDTRDAAGRDLASPGFSLLMLVAVELPPIQLGFGFTLNAVGGLAGINRRLNAAALLAGVRSGAADAMLFPGDPVRDAPVIAGQLGTMFPIAVGRHVFAPMALIGWGTPSLIDIELAVVLEVPDPVLLALIGQASVRLPDDPAIVRLNVDVVGILDPARSLFALDASLRDSNVAGFPVTGDLAMRLAYGSDPSFALAVGGFSPHFDVPPGFPSLRRVTVALGSGDNPRVSIEGYLAVTSNSLQFGARAELYAASGSFNVKGWLGFDALFVFEPFSFRFDFAAGMSLNKGSRRIAGITVDGTLTGPNPFHAWGEGCLSLLFFDICVPFDAVFGSRRDQPALPPADPWVPLRAAITRVENWSAQLPPGAAIGVSLRRAADSPGSLLHPMGVATLRQKVVPLNRPLERFGQFPITGPDRFDVTDVLVGDDPAGSWQPVTDHFAPGDFEALSPTEQLSRDSFEQMDAGVRVGADTIATPAAEVKTAPVEYETKIIDAPDRVRPMPPFRPGRFTQLTTVATGATARAGRAPGARSRFTPVDGRAGGVRLQPEQYAVATVDDLTGRAGVAAGVTRGAAYLALKHTPAAIARDLQVVPAHEVVSA